MSSIIDVPPPKEIPDDWQEKDPRKTFPNPCVSNS